MKKFLLTAIILAGLFLRLYKLPELFYFTHDEETIVWRVMPLLRDRNLFLLGGVTPFHVHLGPWFYYLSAFVLLLSSGNPLGWGLMAAVVSVATMMMLFLVTRRLTPVFLYSFSLLMIAFDRHWWPLSLGPLLVLLVIYNFRRPIFLGLSLAMGFHTDPSNWALTILSLFSRYKIALAILAISFVPLIAFDLKHSGQNILSVKQYLTETKPHQGWSFDHFAWTALYIPRTLGRLIYSPQTELTQIYSYCPQYSQGRLNSAPWFTTLLAVIIIVLFFRPQSSPEVALSAANGYPRRVDDIIRWYFGLVFIGINIYGNFFSSDLFDHYLVTLFPLFFIMFTTVLTRFFGPRLSLVVIIFIIFINLISFSQISNRFGYSDKLAAVKWTTQKLQGQPFSLDVLGSCFRYSGTRYLFTLTGHEPDLSFVDPNFFWLYKTPPKTTYPENHVVFVMPNISESTEFKNKYLDLLGHIIARRQFGNIDVLILNNSSHSFTIPFSQ